MSDRRDVPWWAVVSSALAPVFLIGGWTVAARLQPPGYDPVRDTISALAGRGVTDRWVMSVGLLGLGLCHGLTALGLRPAAPAGRTLLGVGAAGTVLVAAFPVPAAGPSLIHGVVAGLGFVALAVWPACAWRRSARAWTLRRTAAYTATAVLSALVTVFAVQLYGAAGGGHRIGLAERIAAGAEALWPLIVVVGVLVSSRSRERRIRSAASAT